MLNAVLMFGVLYFVYKKRKFCGQVLASFLIYYGISRFIIEFLRGDQDRGLFWGGALSTGQIVMTGTLIIGVVLYIVFRRRSRDR
jgi:phosphatidylglycerol:prolipoprotein diacylglycerol transferase